MYIDLESCDSVHGQMAVDTEKSGSCGGTGGNSGRSLNCISNLTIP